MNTPTPEIWCINLILDTPAGNVQLNFCDGIKARAMQERILKAIVPPEGAEATFTPASSISVEDSYGQKAVIVTSAVAASILNHVESQFRGMGDLAIQRMISENEAQSKIQANPKIQAAQRVAGLRDAFGRPANGPMS